MKKTFSFDLGQQYEEKEINPDDRKLEELSNKYPFFQEGYIYFSFVLPTCLYLSNEIDFYIKLDKEKDPVVLTITEVISNYDTRFGFSKNTEVTSDTDAAFRYSKVNIKLRDLNNKVPEDKLIEVYERDIVMVVNHFLDAFRFVSKRPAIQNIDKLSIMKDFEVGRVQKESLPHRMFSFGFGRNAALTIFKPLHPLNFHTALQEILLKQEFIPLEKSLIMDAYRQNYFGNNIYALISAVTSLEIFVNKKHNKRKFFKRIFNLIVNSIMPYKTLTIKTKEVCADLKLNSELVGLLIGLIRHRNRIIHKGERIFRGDASKYITAVEKLINLETS